MHGLETFSQLVQVGVDASNDAVLQVWDAPVTISDGPRFPHRGLLIDTSRHYLPVDLILHIVDALSYNKCERVFGAVPRVGARCSPGSRGG